MRCIKNFQVTPTAPEHNEDLALLESCPFPYLHDLRVQWASGAGQGEIRERERAREREREITGRQVQAATGTDSSTGRCDLNAKEPILCNQYCK